MSERRLKETLAEAISEGAPAYNRGQAVVCARLYSDVAQELLQSNINSDRAALLQHAVQQAEACGRDHDKAAWVLRHAFDAILDSRPRSPGSSSSSNALARHLARLALADPEDMSERRLMEALAKAIHEGAPAYNRGQVELCRRLYSDVVQEVLRSNINSDMAALLQRALQQAEACGQDHNKAAWILRRAFDEILDSRPRSSGAANGKQPGCCIVQ